MPINLLIKQKGFTLIELLAVMAIVATLAGIVSISVGGSGETSRDTQTQQDATTVESAAADFFSAQVGADTLRSKTVIVLGRDRVEQTPAVGGPRPTSPSPTPLCFPKTT